MDKLALGLVFGAIAVGVVIAVAACMVSGTTDDDEFESIFGQGRDGGDEDSDSAEKYVEHDDGE